MITKQETKKLRRLIRDLVRLRVKLSRDAWSRLPDVWEENEENVKNAERKLKQFIKSLEKS